MLYTCKYDSSGKIVMLMKGGDMASVMRLQESKIRSLRKHKVTPLTFGLVTEFPKELPGDGRPYVHQYLRIKEDHGNGTVAIEYAEKP